MKRIFSMLLVLTLLLSCVAVVRPPAHAASKAGSTRTIAIVFDNSGSMYQKERMEWCRATYAMEVFASGAVEPGDVTVKLATAGRICVITDKPYPHRHLVNYSHIAEGLWYPGTATKAAASSYRWYRYILYTHNILYHLLYK